MWSTGQRVGDYELVAKLREGGMATLFLARTTGTPGSSRHVAMKVIHPSLASDEQFRQMFLDEALLSSRIQHPNVVHVEELGQHDGLFFLTMEFVHGCSLAQLQRALLLLQRRLAPAYAVRIAIEVLDGLHAAHETRDDRGQPLGVVHRDVTPENILLAYAGSVKLIDFGIAKAYGRKHRTQDGLLKGKFRYMAPEQALGKPIDRRVDVYQLGIVLWEMLTLRRLFDAERDIDLLASVQRPRVVPPSALVDGIPSALDAAVMEALHPLPKKRSSDAQSLARQLARALPAVREVDARALRDLLLAAMAEHRRRDGSLYPPGVYERLDQQVLAQALANGGAQLGAPPLERFTVEHATPDGRDAHEGPTRTSERPRRRPRLRRSGEAPADGARVAPKRAGMLTRVGGALGTRARWVALGSAVVLAAALAVLTVALRRARPRTPPKVPMLPSLPVMSKDVSSVSPEASRAESEVDASDASLGVADAGGAAPPGL